MHLCDSADIDPLTQRSVHNHLADLRMLGILSASENRSGSRGNYNSYALDVPIDSALSAMNDVLRLEDEIKSIRETAAKNGLL